jgi:hypothetical protein
MDAIERFYQAKRMKEAYGAPALSGGLDDWPVHDLDTLDLLQREENAYEHAKFEAEHGRGG